MNLKKGKSPKKLEKKLSLKSFTRKEELLKLAQLTEVLATEKLESELRTHLEKRVKELANELF